VKEEIEKLKRDIKRIDKRSDETKIVEKKKVSSIDQEKEEFMKGKRVLVGKRKVGKETDVLAMLNIFKKKLVKAPVLDESEEKGPVCKLHSVADCKSCKDTFGENEEASEEGWLSHKLKFEVESGIKRDDPNELMVIDPRKHNKK
jgi:peptidyl-prolyl cis-trans isomerase SDCCAG10